MLGERLQRVDELRLVDGDGGAVFLDFHRAVSPHERVGKRRRVALAVPQGLPKWLAHFLEFLAESKQLIVRLREVVLGILDARFLDQANAISERGARVAVWNAVPLTVDRSGINHPVVETPVFLAHCLGEIVDGDHVFLVEIRPDIPHLDDIGARTTLYRGRNARLQVRPGKVIGGYSDAVLAAPLFGDLIKKLLPVRDEVARLQYVELTVLEERRRTRG